MCFQINAKIFISLQWIFCAGFHIADGVLVIAPRGRLKFPEAKDCNVQWTTVTYKITWVFPLNPGHGVYLEVFNMNNNPCKHSSLTIQTPQKTERFCGRSQPLHKLIKFEPFRITFRSSASHCMGKIWFDYRYLEMKVMTYPSKTVAVGEKVNFQLLRIRFDDITDSVTCSLTIVDKSITRIFNVSNHLTHAFAQPGPQRFVGECYFRKWKGAVHSDDVINVETPLNARNLNLTFSPRQVVYLKPTVITFIHELASPVLYRFLVGSNAITETKKIFAGSKLRRDIAEFLLDEKFQRLVGPGEFPFKLELSNSISKVEFLANISFNVPLKGANITMKRYVGIAPHYFPIHIHLSQGAPVFVSLEIRKYPGIELESKIHGYCYHKCEHFTLKAKAEKGTHMIDASLRNAYSGVNFKWGPFDALPQVYDAFLTSSTSVQASHVSTILVFIRADLGNYKLVLLHEEKQRSKQVDYYSTSYRHNLGVSLPFDPTRFVLVKVNFVFSKPGLNHIELSIRNEKQIFPFTSGKVFVRNAPSCLKNVFIRGPPMTSLINEVIMVSEEMAFRADVDLQCVDGNTLNIQWGIVRSQDPGKVPDLQKGYMIKSEKQVFELDPNIFESGYYVVITKVTTRRPRSYTVVDSATKYLIVHITGGKVIAFIEGGNIKEIGSQEKSISFSPVVNEGGNRMSFEWYCTLKKNQLPGTEGDPIAYDRDSCLLSNKIQISTEKQFVLPRSFFVPSSIYYVRLIITGARIKPGTFDQEIHVLSHNAPSMKLKCWANCELRLSTQTSLVYFLECPSCMGYRWTFETKGSITVLPHCNGSSICKLSVYFVRSMPRNAVARVRATGIGSDENEVSVTSTAITHNPPHGGSCSFTPPSGRSSHTRFSIRCWGFKQSGLTTYSFRLIRPDSRRRLLQYGTTPYIRDIQLSFIVEHVVVMEVEICNDTHSCTIKRMKVYLFPPFPHELSSSTWRLGRVLNANDLQKINRFLSLLPQNALLLTSEVTTIIELMHDVSLVSLETTKLVADVLCYVSKHVHQISHVSKGLIWKKLLDIKNDIITSKLAISSSAYVADLMRVCIQTIARLMKSPHITINKRREAMLAMEFGRILLMMTSPGEAPIFLRTSLFHAELRRWSPTIVSNDVIIQFGNASWKLPNHITNEEVYIFNTSGRQFGSSSKNVVNVMAINLTTGWQDFALLNGDVLQDLRVNFSLLPTSMLDPASYSEILLYRNCTTKGCFYVEDVPIVLTWKDKREYVGFHWVLPQVTRKLSMSALLWNDETNHSFSGKLFSQFKEKDSMMSYHWLLHSSHLHGNHTNYRFEIAAHDFERDSEVFNYIKIVTFTSACVTWDDVEHDWSQDNCRLIMTDLPTCECRFGAVPREQRDENARPWFFASEMTAKPKAIRKKESLREYMELLRRNPIPIIMVGVAFFIYLNAAFWAFRADKNLFIQKEIVDVHDNSPFHSQIYFVTVFTGNRSGASTTANVAMRLHGTAGKSDVHLIQTEYLPILKRDSSLTFLITAKKPLGNITAVRLWRDNEGDSPEWFLQRIAIRDPCEHECWLVLCEVWFDTTLDHLFMVRNVKEVSDFMTMFLIKFESNMKNEHMLYSVFAMQSWHIRKMSKLERLTILLMHLCLLMTALSQAYLIDDQAPRHKEYYSFRWEDFVIGVLAAVIVYPATLIVTYLFHTTKRRERKGSFYDVYELQEASLRRYSKWKSSENSSELNDLSQHEDTRPRPTSQSGLFDSIVMGRYVEDYDDHLSQDSTTYFSAKKLGFFQQYRAKLSQFGKKLKKNIKVPFQSYEEASDYTTADYIPYPSTRSPSLRSRISPAPVAGPKTKRKISIQVVERYTPPPISTLHWIGFCQCLPWWFKAVPWILSAIAILFGCVHAVNVSLKVKSFVSKKWSVSVVSGLVASFTFFEIVKVFLLSIVHTLDHHSRGDVNLEDWLPPLYQAFERRKFDDPKAEHELQRKERKENPAYRPTAYADVKEKEKIRAENRRLKRRIKDVFVHILYLVLLTMTVVGEGNYYRYNFGKTLKQMIVEPTSQVANYKDVYKWLNNSMAEMFTSTIYKHFIDRQVVLLSGPTLRQKRIRQNLICSHTAVAVFLNLTSRLECKEHLTDWNEDKFDYGPGWLFQPEVINPYYSLEKSPWRYTTREVPWLVHYYGKHGVYNGEGYYLHLPPKNPEALQNMSAYLERNNWVDSYTRALLLEMVLYNVVSDVYATFTIAIELTNIGTASVTSSVSYTLSHLLLNTIQIVGRVCLYGTIVIVIYTCWGIFREIQQHKYKYFLDHWNLVHFLATLLSGLEAFLYLTSTAFADDSYQAYLNNQTSFYLFHSTSHLSYMIRCILSASIFLTLFYTVRILQGHPVFFLLHKTFKRAKKELEGHTLYMVLIFTAFCHLGVLLFSESSDFKDVIATIQTVLGYSMEAFTSTDLLTVYPTIGWFYLLGFVFLFTKVFVNFYVTILENSFRESKLLQRDFHQKINILTFGHKYLRSMFTIRDQKLTKMKSKEEKANYLRHLRRLKGSDKYTR